jgi:hypothetical protein
VGEEIVCERLQARGVVVDDAQNPLFGVIHQSVPHRTQRSLGLSYRNRR